jgi:hypothetical protein
LEHFAKQNAPIAAKQNAPIAAKPPWIEDQLREAPRNCCFLQSKKQNQHFNYLKSKLQKNH